MKTCLLMTAAALLIAFGTANADKDDHGQRLRAAVASGQIVPLKSLLDRIEANYFGQVLEVELDDDDDQLTYEIDFLTPAGAKIEFEFDATNGHLLKSKGRGLEEAARPK